MVYLLRLTRNHEGGGRAKERAIHLELISGRKSSQEPAPGRSRMSRGQTLAACLVLALLACTGCQARITDALVSKEDRALFPIATPFGFGPDGHIEITLKDLQPWHRTGEGVADPDLARMGFFLTTSEAQTLLEFDLSQVGTPSSLGMPRRGSREPPRTYLDWLSDQPIQAAGRSRHACTGPAQRIVLCCALRKVFLSMRPEDQMVSRPHVLTVLNATRLPR